MDSSMVVKVKYGDTLRRFSVHIAENGHLDINIGDLRAKICSLFNFSPDVDLSLTYVDEDGDIVALVDDSDIFHVMTQQLKFLRINVQLNNGRDGKYSGSSESSTPLGADGFQNSLPNIDTGGVEALKFLPEPLREAMTKLSCDLASKAASSSPVLAEIVDRISKMGQLSMQPPSQSQFSTEGGSCEKHVAPVGNNDSNAAKDTSLPVEALKHAGFPSTSESGKEVETGNMDGDANMLPIPTFCDFSFLDRAADLTMPPVSSAEKKFNESDNHGEVKSAGLAASSNCGPATIVQELQPSGKSSSPFVTAGKSLDECPFTGMPIGTMPTDSAAPPVPPVFPSHIHSVNRSHNRNDALGGVFHSGVGCDECGAYPITGPRYKSKVRHNFDLCRVCFAKMGNEADYTRMDRPYRRPHPFKGFSEVPNIWASQPFEPSFFKGFGMKPRPKLDSRFILDVNVIDGTIMAPSTTFTKIWRMKNNGSFVWPQGTQIVWIGGDQLSDAASVELEVPADGVPVQSELDVAVDFVAPESPGRYTSYWRMASATGQKFGQRVWVSIQVHASLKVDDTFGQSQRLNLNLPPCTGKSKGPEIIEVSVQPLTDGNLPYPCNENMAQQPVEPKLEENSNGKDTKSFDIWHPTPIEVSAALKYPKFSMFEAPPVVAPYHEPVPVTVNPGSSKERHDINPQEETLLKDLAEMGFTEEKLNKQILRENNYSLEQTVNALCGFARWEPLLKELEEMGFNDKEMNIRLLQKNNGSIKRVVMDLITGEQA